MSFDALTFTKHSSSPTDSIMLATCHAMTTLIITDTHLKSACFILRCGHIASLVHSGVGAVDLVFSFSISGMWWENCCCI